MSARLADAMTVHCPTCGARPGQRCTMEIKYESVQAHGERFYVFDRNHGPKKSGVYWYRDIDGPEWHVGKYDAGPGLWTLLGYEGEDSTLGFRIREWVGPISAPT